MAWGVDDCREAANCGFVVSCSHSPIIQVKTRPFTFIQSLFPVVHKLLTCCGGALPQAVHTIHLQRCKSRPTLLLFISASLTMRTGTRMFKAFFLLFFFMSSTWGTRWICGQSVVCTFAGDVKNLTRGRVCPKPMEFAHSISVSVARLWIMLTLMWLDVWGQVTSLRLGSDQLASDEHTVSGHGSISYFQ